VVPVEPRADHIAQITDMGFTEALARKALVLTRDNVQEALEWVFAHGEEPGADAPPTQEELRAVSLVTNRVAQKYQPFKQVLPVRVQ